MATLTLLPDNETGINQWQDTGIGAADYTDVNSDDQSTYIREYTNSHEVTFTFTDPAVTIAGGDVTSWTSVKVYLKAKYTTSGDQDVDVYVMGNSAETITVSGTTWTTYSTAAFTTWNGSHDWLDPRINALQVKFDKNGFAGVRQALLISYIYAVVTYVPSVPSGYGNDVIGIDSGDIAKVNGIATADISKVNGV